MIIPHTIFTPQSVQPLLTIWHDIQLSARAALRHRSANMGDEFATIANAFKALAMDNDLILSQHYPKQASRQSHEALCADQVKERYNTFVEQHNKQCRASGAIALGDLFAADPLDIIAAPSKDLALSEPVQHALQLARHDRQYWSSAIVFLRFARSALNIQDTKPVLHNAACNIEDKYFTPLEQLAYERWLTLLVIGGDALQLQLAREELGRQYVSGVYSMYTLTKTMDNATNDHLRQALAHAVVHPTRLDEGHPPDLGL